MEVSLLTEMVVIIFKEAIGTEKSLFPACAFYFSKSTEMHEIHVHTNKNYIPFLKLRSYFAYTVK